MVAGTGFDIGKAELIGELPSDAREFAAAQGVQHVGAVDHAALLFARQTFRDQPLTTAGLGLTQVAAKAGIAGGFRLAGDEFAVEPCCEKMY